MHLRPARPADADGAIRGGSRRVYASSDFALTVATAAADRRPRAVAIGAHLRSGNYVEVDS